MLPFTVVLRPGLRFSDGHPITSEDVLFSFAVAYDSTLHPAIQDLITVNGRKFEVSAPDSYTIVTKLPSLLVLAADVIGSVNILPKHVLEPIFILEAVINGILLGGVLALLALGLNLIFGVIDIVWIAYVGLVALCMYGVYFLVTLYGWPLWLAGLGSIAIGAGLGVLVHLLIITPILSSPPINQLLATGGLLFFIQSVATLLWSTDHRSVRVSLPTIEVGGIFISFSRLLAFGLSVLAMIALYLFLKRTYTGTAIRAVSQDREAIALMGARPQRLYLVTSAVGGAMAGVAGALLIIQYAVHPYFGGAFGPLTFMICVLGGLGNMVGAFFAAFIMAQVISVGGVMVSTEMGYVIAFVIFIVLMFVRPGGIFAKRG